MWSPEQFIISRDICGGFTLGDCGWNKAFGWPLQQFRPVTFLLFSFLTPLHHANSCRYLWGLLASFCNVGGHVLNHHGKRGWEGNNKGSNVIDLWGKNCLTQSFLKRKNPSWRLSSTSLGQGQLIYKKLFESPKGQAALNAVQSPIHKRVLMFRFWEQCQIREILLKLFAN